MSLFLHLDAGRVYYLNASSVFPSTHSHTLVCYNNLVKSARKREADLCLSLARSMLCVAMTRFSPGAGARTETQFDARSPLCAALLIRRLSELANYRCRAQQLKYNFHRRMKFSHMPRANTHTIPIPFKYNSRLMASVNYSGRVCPLPFPAHNQQTFEKLLHKMPGDSITTSAENKEWAFQPPSQLLMHMCGKIREPCIHNTKVHSVCVVCSRQTHTTCKIIILW
jgi:hypothetical protein